MAGSVGQVVGAFEILEPLGKGGMGEVFKARDRRLNRFVALKFLPATASRDARERFQREALAIAALSHPNICVLHEVGDDHGRPYLVLELLEGETLRARLGRGVPSTEQLLDWALQIAEALDAAHRRGVLHRDLKPENIFVSPQGNLKVLDFGLARLDAPDPSGEDRTITSPGMTLGTLPYMSPEQARGETLDARSDLFSFGAVFYEMATGRAAFGPNSSAEIIAAILKEQPTPARQLRPDLPPRLEEVAGRCLEKDPDLRYQTAADLRSDLKRIKRETHGTPAAVLTSQTPVAIPAAAPPPAASDSQIAASLLRRHWQKPVWALVAVLLLAAGWWRFAPRAAASISLQIRPLTFSGQVLDAAISPDGKFLAHIDATPAGVSLHLLSVATGSDVEIVAPGRGCCAAPSFSPDGNFVYFLDDRTIDSVPVLGGSLHAIADNACSGAAFSPDGQHIAFIARDQAVADSLMVARADGSEPRTLRRAEQGAGYQAPNCWTTGGNDPDAPAWAPDGRSVASGYFRVGGRPLLATVDLATGSQHTVDSGILINALTWPESGALVATGNGGNGRSQVWRVTLPSGSRAPLTNDLQGYTGLTLAAGGAMALVHAVPQSSIWAQAANGGGRVPPTRGRGRRFGRCRGPIVDADGHDCQRAQLWRP